MTANCKVAREERVLRITLARAEKRNALSPDFCQAIVAAVEAAQGNREIGSVLIDAEGAVFCAGMDLDEATEAATAVHERLFTLGFWSRKPVVVAVQGPALGGGLGLVANAHIAVAAQGATFALTEIRLAMWPYVIWRAVRNAVGERRTLELALTGKVFGVNEAVSYGLVHEVVPAIEIDDRATALAHHLSQLSPDAMARGLAFAAEARGLGFEEQGARALAVRAESFASADFAEGIASMKEKRRPAWPSLQ